MKPLIPALRRVVEASRKHASYDGDLDEALAELEATEAENARQRAENLRVYGKACSVCGKHYLPYPYDGGCCSIGCRYK